MQTPHGMDGSLAGQTIGSIVCFRKHQSQNAMIDNIEYSRQKAVANRMIRFITG